MHSKYVELQEDSFPLLIMFGSQGTSIIFICAITTAHYDYTMTNTEWQSDYSFETHSFEIGQQHGEKFCSEFLSNEINHIFSRDYSP